MQRTLLCLFVFGCFQSPYRPLGPISGAQQCQAYGIDANETASLLCEGSPALEYSAKEPIRTYALKDTVSTLIPEFLHHALVLKSSNIILDNVLHLGIYSSIAELSPDGAATVEHLTITNSEKPQDWDWTLFNNSIVKNVYLESVVFGGQFRLSKKFTSKITSERTLSVTFKKSGLKAVNSDVFDGLDSLRMLDLSYNDLTIFDPLLCPLVQVWHVNLSSNRFTWLHSTIFVAFPNLSHLNLSYNQLRTVGSLDDIAKLAELWVIGNKLLDSYLVDLEQLQTDTTKFKLMAFNQCQSESQTTSLSSRFWWIKFISG
ncbi:hypothetical protein HDE_13799 [Halotydeus destructor]|nr:hypothetical protein HDE_13799 [Halotydeus destructor]